MSAVTQLINVKYTDLTNYTEGAGNDILGVPFEHHWGPVNELNTLSQPAFFQLYPESLPIGRSTLTSPQRYYAYAQAKKCLELPNNLVEAYRIQGGWKYAEINLLKTIVEPEQGQPVVYFTTAEAAKQFAAIENMAAVISLKYPGIPPKSLLGDYDRLAIVFAVDKETQVFTISVCGATQVTEAPVTGLYIKEGTAQTEKFFAVDEDAPIETFEGGVDPNQLVDGKSFFIEDVVATSDFISVKVNSANPVPESILKTAVHLLSICTIPEEPTTQDWNDALQVFDDTLVSDASLLISPVATADCDTKLLAIAASRQDLQGVVGFPVATVFNKANIMTFLTNLAGVRNMFGVFVAGREMTKVFGYNIQLNCTGGWAGSTFNIAKQVRTNQLASAFTYGAYNGTLTETLSFDDVCELHKKGVISVFSSVNGPMIWGTRSLHTRQMSYFGKANVMRVLSKILRRVFPECLNAVHTDAAANPITTANFQTRFTSIINEEIAQQNLISDSYAACTGDINSDVKTKGGTIFNLVLVLHFIGLVESININVFATDSSVTAKIV